MTQPNHDRPTLRVRRLREGATLPAYHSELAAGLDLAACLDGADGGPAGELTLRPSEIVKVPTGLSVAIPPGYEGQVRARSGLSTRHGIGLPNAPGTIDADYRGELHVAMINWGRESYTIHHGDRIAQLVIAPIAHVSVAEVEQLDETARGSGGFGSTGGLRSVPLG